MAKWKKNFHNSIRNRTLFGDAILWLLTKRRIIRKYTADLVVIDRAYHRLEKKYKKRLWLFATRFCNIHRNIRQIAQYGYFGGKEWTRLRHW